MTTRRFVIIGGGLAAATAAETLRDEGFDGDVMVVGAERHLPYLRPPLSKEYLNDPGQEPAGTYVHPWEWYPQHDIHVLTGTLAVELDLADRRIVLWRCPVRMRRACTTCARSTTAAPCGTP
jgi:3-phenylpropionate/trans-cinnamate dioxygenase ferredoxin reductase subunit